MVAGATSESNIAVLLNGYIPVLLKADFLETWPSCMHGLDVSFTTLFFVILMPGFSGRYIWHSLLYIDLKDPDTATSNGCVKWLVSGGKTKRTL